MVGVGADIMTQCLMTEEVTHIFKLIPDFQYESCLKPVFHFNRIVTYLPRPQALIKKFHASHYMKGLHEVVHRDEQSQGVMGLRHRKLRSAWDSRFDHIFYDYIVGKVWNKWRLSVAQHVYFHTFPYFSILFQ